MRCPTLVGREAELTELTDALARAGRDEGGWVTVTGEAGVGKTRLAEEVVAVARSSGVVITRGRATVVDRATPHRPLAEALLTVASEVRRPTDEEVAPYAAAVARFIPHWRSGDAPVPLEAPAVIAESFRRIVGWCAAGRPVLVLLEDLHWADADTSAALAHLADQLHRTSMLVVATARPEETDPTQRRELRATRSSTCRDFRRRP